MCQTHAYGLEPRHCTECGVQIAATCPECGYESRYDDEHRPGCSLAPPDEDPPPLGLEPRPDRGRA